MLSTALSLKRPYEVRIMTCCCPHEPVRTRGARTGSTLQEDGSSFQRHTQAWRYLCSVVLGGVCGLSAVC